MRDAGNNQKTICALPISLDVSWRELDVSLLKKKKKERKDVISQDHFPRQVSLGRDGATVNIFEMILIEN